MKLTGDELEFALSQYHDGTLNAIERAAIDEVLATDAGARATLAEIAKLDALVKRAPAGPEIAWDKFRASVSNALDEAEAPAALTFKIGTWTRVVGGVVALAAAIGVVVSVTMRSQSAKPPSGGEGQRVAQVTIGPGASESTATAAASSAVLDVAVGPSPQMALSGGGIRDWEYESAFLERPGRVVIAVSPEPAQDAGGNSPSPF